MTHAIDNPIVKEKPDNYSREFADFMKQYEKPIIPSRLSLLRESFERVNVNANRR